ncbi:MAG: hypothetical protein KDK91_20255 [Gammaproteobacteria bacterium]|nr:hypothetical protein [Gammaproteobacteria bacterium]
MRTYLLLIALVFPPGTSLAQSSAPVTGAAEIAPQRSQSSNIIDRNAYYRGLDTNADHQISRVEAMKDPDLNRIFPRLDADSNGSIERDELTLHSYRSILDRKSRLGTGDR